MATTNDKPQLTREQFTDQEWQAVGNLFHFLRRLQLEGKIGRKAA
jgi:hypothetical protein